MVMWDLFGYVVCKLIATVIITTRTEEWTKNALKRIQTIYEFKALTIQAVIIANGDPTHIKINLFKILRCFHYFVQVSDLRIHMNALLYRDRIRQRESKL